MPENKKQNTKWHRTVKFITLGCKVNQYETQGLKEKFSLLGCQVTNDKAEVYVINSCTVTHRADRKSKEAILRAKKENPRAKIAVCGCLVQLGGDFIKAEVDYVIPQDQKHLLPEIILGSLSGKEINGNYKDIWSLKINRFSNQRAFVKVQDGCSNLCSFCKIPHLRGLSHSRLKEEAIEEIERVSLFHREIVLCGVNLSLYGRDLAPPLTLQDLVKDALDLPHLGRLRLSSLEPFFLNKRLFALLSNSKLCPHLHFPFQSGDDKILAAMNKKERVSRYEEVVHQARGVFSDIAISCDVIVGFPGETEASFQNTVDFLNRIKPMRMHIFTFSPRQKTQFSKMQVKDQGTVRRRYNFLKTLGDEFSLQYKRKFLGKILNMITEEKNKGFVSGYTENYIRVYVNEDVPLGEILPVKIVKIERNKVFASVYKHR